MKPKNLILKFPPDSIERIDALQIACHTKDRAQVVQLALLVLEDQVRFIQEGGDIFWCKGMVKQRYSPVLVTPDMGGPVLPTGPSNVIRFPQRED